MGNAIISRPAAVVLILVAALTSALSSASADGAHRWKSMLPGLATDRARFRLRAVIDELRDRLARERPDLLPRLHLGPAV